MRKVIERINSAATAVEAVSIYQASAWELDGERPMRAGYWHSVALPKRKDGADWAWCRVDTRGTGNGGRWVATRPLSERARALRSVLMDTLARLLPGFNVAFLATRPLFWERPILEWMGSLSPEMAEMLGDRPSVESRRQAEALEWKGFILPETSIPRTAAAIALAAEAARRAK